MAELDYRFGPFVVDRTRYRVQRSDQVLELTPKLLDLLLHLLDHAGALVTKEQLLEALWPGANVTDNALAQAVSELRQALGDEAGTPQYIKTVARRGYRFIAPVERFAAPASAPSRPWRDTSSLAGTGPETAVDRGNASIAVLDLVNVTGDADSAWLSAGIAETVTGDLRATGCFRVIDRGRVMEALRALNLYPEHAQSLIGLALALHASGSREAARATAARLPAITATLARTRPIEAALVESQIRATEGKLEDAGARLCALLNAAPPGFAAWTIPIEPFLRKLSGTKDSRGRDEGVRPRREARDARRGTPAAGIGDQPALRGSRRWRRPRDRHLLQRQHRRAEGRHARAPEHPRECRRRRADLRPDRRRCDGGRAAVLSLVRIHRNYLAAGRWRLWRRLPREPDGREDDWRAATIDDAGFVRITDRLSRFSKIAGEMVPHLKVEEQIQALLDDDQAAVVTSVPDQAKGERLVAFFTDTAMTPQQLWARLCQTNLPRLWLPKREDLHLAESIPTLGTGKVDLRRVRQLALDREVSTTGSQA